MKWQEQQALSFVLEKMREISSHNNHGEVEQVLLQALQHTNQGWAGQVCQALLEAFAEAPEERKVEEKLLELAAILIKWSMVLERERNLRPESLEEGEEVFVVLPDKKLKFLGVVVAGQKIAIAHLDQVVSMEDVYFFRKKKPVKMTSSGSSSLQKAIAEELFKLGI